MDLLLGCTTGHGYAKMLDTWCPGVKETSLRPSSFASCHPAPCARVFPSKDGRSCSVCRVPAFSNRLVGVLQGHRPFHMRTIDSNSNVFSKEGQDLVSVNAKLTLELNVRTS